MGRVVDLSTGKVDVWVELLIYLQGQWMYGYVFPVSTGTVDVSAGLLKMDTLAQAGCLLVMTSGEQSMN